MPTILVVSTMRLAAHPLMLVCILNSLRLIESFVLMARQLFSKFPYLAALFTEELEVLRLMAATSTSVPLEDLFMPTSMA